MLTVVIKLAGSILMPPGSKGREVSLQNSSVLLMHKQSGTCSAVSRLSPLPSPACSQAPGPNSIYSLPHCHLCSALTYAQIPPCCFLSEPWPCCACRLTCHHLECVCMQEACSS